MPMDEREIINIIKARLPNADVEVIDTAGDQDHYKVYVTSIEFEGLSVLQQHKLVYSAFGNKLGNQLHSLSLETFIK